MFTHPDNLTLTIPLSTVKFKNHVNETKLELSHRHGFINIYFSSSKDLNS
jgi:hypothetical protein